MNAFTYDIPSETRSIFGERKRPRVRHYSRESAKDFRSRATDRESVYGYFIPMPSASEFERLARIWKADTALQSNITLKSMHPAYQQLIGMGKSVVPFMLRDFQSGKLEHWFWALKAIVGDEGPSASGIDGNVAAMAEAWVTWGKAKGYL